MSRKFNPAVNARTYVQRKPPIFLFTVCLLFVAVALVGLSLHVTYEERGVSEDLHSVVEQLVDSPVCLSPQRPPSSTKNASHLEEAGKNSSTPAGPAPQDVSDWVRPDGDEPVMFIAQVELSQQFLSLLTSAIRNGTIHLIGHLASHEPSFVGAFHDIYLPAGASNLPADGPLAWVRFNVSGLEGVLLYSSLLVLPSNVSERENNSISIHLNASQFDSSCLGGTQLKLFETVVQGSAHLTALPLDSFTVVQSRLLHTSYVVLLLVGSLLLWASIWGGSPADSNQPVRDEDEEDEC
ncbi:unnamed protein product [Darwinula stevensoni]|uniref:TMEM248/TMEM219 domain-containing protein n=1 Tax=Darwinula stevensoni TaxID=69355 RepID=A0A7R9A9I2_9CRUS|nr:unnamed protein product [Darwinula stevensoni]CAG0897440.1 unnamed protein product [Darwinula stevensoni]